MILFSKLDKLISGAEKLLVIVSLSAMVLLTFLNVLFRALYRHGDLQWAGNMVGRIDWSEPFARQMVLWVAFLGASLLTGDKKHIRIEIPGILTSPLWSSLKDFIISTACVLICFFMLRASIEYISMEIRYSSTMLAGIPGWVFQLIIPAGFSIMLFRFFLNVLKDLLSVLSGVRS